MGVLFKQSFYNTLIYYIRTLIISFNVFWLFPLVCTPEEIGLYKFVLGSITLIVTIIEFGLPQSIIKYIHRFEKNPSPFFTLIFGSATILFLIFCSLVYIFKGKIISFYSKETIVITYFNLILASSLAFFYSLIVKSILRGYYHSVFPTFTQNILVFVLISFSAVLYKVNYITFDQTIKAVFFIFLICFLFNLFYLLFIVKIKFYFSTSGLSKKFIEEFIKFNFYTFSSNTRYIIADKIDTLMIVAMLNLKSNGIYATVLMFAKLIEIPRKGIKQISVPLISSMLYNKDTEKIRTYYKKISANQFIMSGFIFSIVIGNLDQFFNLLPNKIYLEGKTVVIFLGITKLIDSYFSTGSDLILMSRYFRFNLVSISFLIISCILLNYFFIPIYSLSGAAFATMLSYIIFNFINFMYVYQKFHILPFTYMNFYTFIAIIASIIISRILPNIDAIFFSLFLKIITSTVAYFGILYLFKKNSKY